MAQQKFTKTCLGLFTSILRSPEFKEEMDLREAKTLDILQWIHNCNVEEATELRQLLVKKNRERLVMENVQSLFKEAHPALRELGSNQMRQIFKVALSFYIYSRKDERVGELFDEYVLTGILRPSMFVGSNYIPAKTDVRASNRVESERFATKAPKTFEVILAIHAMNTCQHMYTQKGRKKGTATANKIRAHYQTSNRMGFAVQLLFNAWTSLARAIGLHDFQEMVAPYILFMKESGTFKVLSRREDGFAPRSQSESLLNTHQSSLKRDLVDVTAFDRSTEADHAFRAVTARFFRDLKVLITHNYLYESDGKDKDWSMLEVYRLRREGIPTMFSSLPKEVLTGIGYWREKRDRNGRERIVMHEVIDVDGVTEQSDAEPDEISCVMPMSKRKRKLAEKSRQVPEAEEGHVAAHSSARFIKVEEELAAVSYNNNPGNVSESLRTKGEEEYERLSDALFDFMSSKYCRIHDVPFSDLIDTDADESGFYLNGKVDFIVTDPPYNTRSQRCARNSSYDVLTEADMKDCVGLFDALLKKGGHGLIFCSSLQFHKWFELLKQYTACQKDMDSDESSQPLRNLTFNPFHVEEVMMHFQSSPGHYTRDPAKKSAAHMSVVQTAIHFWKKGTPEKDNSDGMVNYESQGYIPSRHAAWTNCIDNIPRLDPEERLYFQKGMGGKQGMVRPEQKSVLLLLEIISQYTKEGDVVVDMFGGTFSTAKACLNLPKYRTFIGCDSDKNCVKLAIPHVLVAFAKQLCNNASNINGTGGVKEIAREFLHHPRFTAREATKCASPWDPPVGLPMYQRLPEHVHRYIASVTMDGAISFQYRHVPPDKWPNMFRSYLNTADVRALLNIEAASKGLVICKSSIRHRLSGAGVFAARPFKKGEYILTYYGTVVYRDLGMDSASTKEYGSGVLAVRKNRFLRAAVELRSKVVDDDGKDHQVFIVPTPFCVGSCINDPRYLPGDEDWAEISTLNQRKPNVIIVQTECKLTKKLLRSNKLLVIEACRDILFGEELFIHYGSKYATWGATEN